MRFVKEHLNKNQGLLKHSLIILIGTTLVNVVNYLYQLFMGRMLGPAGYGVLGALFSLIYIVTFSFGTIRTVVTKFTASYAAQNKLGKVAALLIGSFRKLAVLSVVGFVLFLGISVYLSKFLNIQYSLFVLTGIFLALSLLSPVPNGILNGLQRYTTLTVISFISALVKLGLGVLFVVLGYGVFGAVIGLTLSQLIALGLPFLFLLTLFSVKSEPVSKTDLFHYTMPVFLALTLMHLFVNVDVLFVKHYFSAEEAGNYVAASMIGKAILFSTSALLTTMFPKVSFSHEQQEDSSKFLKATLFYTLIIVGTAVILYFTIPTFLSKTLFGGSYSIAPYLGLFGLAIGLFSVSNVLVTYQLALNQTQFVYFMLPLLLVEVAGFILFHSTLLEMIQVVLVVNVMVLAYLLFTSRKAFNVNAL